MRRWWHGARRWWRVRRVGRPALVRVCTARRGASSGLARGVRERRADRARARGVVRARAEAGATVDAPRGRARREHRAFGPDLVAGVAGERGEPRRGLARRGRARARSAARSRQRRASSATAAARSTATRASRRPRARASRGGPAHLRAGAPANGRVAAPRVRARRRRRSRRRARGRAAREVALGEPRAPTRRAVCVVEATDRPLEERHGRLGREAALAQAPAVGEIGVRDALLGVPPREALAAGRALHETVRKEALDPRLELADRRRRRDPHGPERDESAELRLVERVDARAHVHAPRGKSATIFGARGDVSPSTQGEAQTPLS